MSNLVDRPGGLFFFKLSQKKENVKFCQIRRATRRPVFLQIVTQRVCGDECQALSNLSSALGG